jgi:type I restriction enzyme S subunit
LNISSLKDGRLDLLESDHVSDEDFSRWTRRVTPQGGDLLFSYETRLGEAALMPEGVRACLGRRMALLRPDQSVVDPRFLLYMYLGPEFRSTIEQHTIHGATVNRIPLKTMDKWMVQVPGLSEQRAIAEVLGSLDDKIAVNTDIADAAEALAVSEIACFPRSVALGEVAVQAKVSIDPQALDSALVSHYALPAFDAGREPELVPPGSIKSSKFLVDQPGVLVSKLNPRFPRVWCIPDLPEFMALASTEFVVIRSNVCSPAVLWALTIQPTFGAALEGMVAGTSGSHQRVKPAEMLATEVADPRVVSGSVLERVEALVLRAIAARDENRTLAVTRDALLPHLMSGKLRVRDAERIAEDPASAVEQLAQEGARQAEAPSDGLW